MTESHPISAISKLPVRIYYEDTDAGGIVYHASYIKFAERARSEFLREWGVPARSLLPDHQFQIVVRHLAADYFAPAYLDDLLNIESCVIDLGNASFTMDQKITRDGIAIADLKVVLVCVNTNGKPIRVPDVLRSKIQKGNE
ncbi:MAG TPA: YbgC/FadM family acyl-CoA thioesterase [Alphaproteobacteria bacterium]